MPLDIIVGTQWGDEGKGHITDRLAGEADLVARFSGGDNAGHTVAIGDEIYKLHLIPSGIIHSHVTCVIGNGVVVNPEVLIREIDDLKSRGVEISPHRLRVSDRAHLITPGHIAMDAAQEADRGKASIGTTQRGIGPAYTDKTARSGLRAGLLADPEELADKIAAHIEAKNRELDRFSASPKLNTHEITSKYVEYSRRLKDYLADSSNMLNQAILDGKSVLAEGAQGTQLDLDHGTYPFVTSSWPTAGGALIGLGLGPKTVRRVIGVAKAFTSRVGSGPLPSEQSGEVATRLRGTGEMPWDEFGTTTGRPRRVGWLDLTILRYAVQVNGLTELALTKLDILSGLPELPVCVAYDLDGERIDSLPADLKVLANCRPIYHSLAGWSEDITGARAINDLPSNARQYIDFVAENVGIPIHFVSIGPGRDQIISC
ncbi:MAG: adenylosuccinate synthase [Chloroflexota bacterium]|jgi:adenylosuccinate synthase